MKIRRNLPKCRALVGTTCVVALALAGKLQEWIDNWPCRQWSKN